LYYCCVRRSHACFRNDVSPLHVSIIDSLQETEQKLDEITKEQGTNTAHLIELMNENQTILNKMNVCEIL
jgi:mevalonate kinase